MRKNIEKKKIENNIHRIKSFIRSKRYIALALTVMLFTVACGGGGAELTVEQLTELEETKTAALAAEENIQQRKATQKTLSENLTVKKKELNQLLTDKELLIKRLKDLENLTKDETDADTNGVETNSEDNGDGR